MGSTDDTTIRRNAEMTAALPGRRVPRVVRQFLDTEAAGGIVLLVAAVVALVWANSPWQESYRTLWSTDLRLNLGRYVIEDNLQHWVNDALMAIFFFVVGLEIKRELVHGDLRDRRAAALPAVAAAGGMVVPALLYLMVTAGGDATRGWGIPMATDIAFAIGVVSVLGPRVPASLKLFLLTLAIVDDIGAIVVIALFYAGNIQPEFLVAAALLVVVMLAIRKVGVVWLAPYVLLGMGVWLATRASGVHATIAGVVLGLLAPAQPLIAGTVARRWVSDLADEPGPAEMAAMTRLAKTSVSPAERLEHLLHPWTSFVIVPVFALANAGVQISGDTFSGSGTTKVAAGVVLGLLAGKTIGITAGAWLAVRSGLGRLPENVTWPMIAAVATVGGIGFTVSLFITELAFAHGPLQDAAKVGVLAASTLAAVIGAVGLKRACRNAPE
ncbi:MAG TPA: Na+/H+ antiporter NhaA [Acidimicrobiales bacterium]|nr:Na+/H+ antiporter NhaA [Acidimicrobiales bacterium]